MTRILIIIVLGFQLISCSTQKQISSQTTQQENYLIKGNYKMIEGDHLGNLYLVGEDNGIEVYDKDLKKLFQYSVRRLGNISEIDVRNPQKILVYYGNYLKVIFLDNTLSQIKELDLEALGYWDVQCVALSRDNLIWMYDPVNGRLQKINDNGEVVLSSNETFSASTDIVNTQNMAIAQDKVLINIGEKVLMFDEFGNYVKDFQEKADDIKTINKKVYLKKDKQIKELEFVERLQKHNTFGIEIPVSVKDFFVAGNRLYLLDQFGLFISDL